MKVTHKNSEIEGTPQEIHDLFQNNGMDLNAFFITPKPVHTGWVITPIIIWIILLCIGVFQEIEQVKLRTLIFLLMASCSVWIAASVKKKYEYDITFISIITLILIVLSMAGIGFIPINKVFDYISKIS
ncbi:hypothetical protein ACT4VX_15635 [Acinetobacter baumannii]|uniref:hypothetical protein n=1 Tax=Acinetobacter baumannii TaxID=470 RepID=UPI002AB343BB|nr:hypothetical protein [Acinetobacter baumannii]